MASKKAAPEGPVEVPEVISILPLRNSVLFPGSIIPIDVGRKKSVKLVEEAISKERPVIGIVTQRDARTEDPGPGDLYMVGCAARILKVIKLAKDNFSVILQGVSRIRILEVGGVDPFMTARVQALPDSSATDVELDALVMNVKDVAKRVIKLMPELPKEASALVDSVVEPGQLSDVIISNLDVQVDEKQDVLETFDLKTRLRKVLQFLSRQHEVLKVREKINSQVQEEMGRNQREYVLRQQLKAIKEELGEIDETGGDLDDFREKIVASKMPPDTEKVAIKQLERLKVMQPSSAEYTVTRTYLEWLVELPWAVSTEDKLDIQEARNILNTDHYDLEKVKKRILEYLAVRKLKSDKKGPILCLVGPPGVGKTSLGRSIARVAGAQVRPHLAGRRARRGRDPRPPPHVRRVAARASHSGHEEGRVEQPGVHARRDRQAGTRLPGRSGSGAAGGARPRAEQHLLGPLPGGPVRPVEGDVRRDREHHGPDAAGVARPHGDARAPGLHARGEAVDREAVPGPEAARGARADGREAGVR